MRLGSKDITDENIKKILELFPNVATEAKDENGELRTAIDFDKLKQELSKDVVDGEECYDFTWVGKKEAMVEANRPIRKTLRPDRESSVDWENTQNIYIEGDNLEALKLLQESYLGKVKMIYIDPPYNTGKDFVYKDNFHKNNEDNDKDINYKNDEAEINFSKSNELFLNTESNGRFHSDWCSMIYSRLKLARNLLSDDGVIFISIDDNEINNLRKVCDEVFGEMSFITSFIWEKTQHFGRQKLNSYCNTDYILCYAKSIYNNSLKELLVEKINDELLDAPLYNASNNVQKLTFPSTSVKFNIQDGVYNQTTSPDYILQNPVEVVNGRNKNEFSLAFKSRWSAKTVLEEIKKGTTFWVKTESFAIRAIYGEGKISNVAPKQIIFTNEKNPHCAYSRFNKRVLTSESASNSLKELMDRDVFSYPKPVSLIEYLCSLLYDYNAKNFENDFAVLDFFSGSATTAQAIMQLNSYDLGKRKFILVQLPEITSEDVIYKNICEIGKERIRRAGKKIQEENPDKKIDVGFRVFKVDDTNMKDVYYSPNETDQKQLGLYESNIKDDRTDEDLLYGCLLDWGVELSLPHRVETIDDKRVHIVDEDALVACFEENIPESVIRKIAGMKPLRVVFRDSSFNSDDNKINVEEIFKLITPDTRVKVI